MAIGTSGRIVVEVDPELKRQLYAELDRQGLTMKGWLTDRAQNLLNNQLPLDFEHDDPGTRQDRSHN